jgi:hypothetical protein
MLHWFLVSLVAASWAATFFGLGHFYGVRSSDREWTAAIARGRDEENRRRRERRAAKKAREANRIRQPPESGTPSQPQGNSEDST